MHFIDKFNQYLLDSKVNIKNKDIKSTVYPILAREFFKTAFDKHLVDFYLSKLDRDVPKKKIYFVFGSFLQPKTAINTVQLDQEQVSLKLRFHK